MYEARLRACSSNFQDMKGLAAKAFEYENIFMYQIEFTEPMSMKVTKTRLVLQNLPGISPL